MLKIIVALGLAVLAGCTTSAQTVSCTPISICANQILSEATSLHQLEMALAALQQAPVVVMQPTPVVVTPNPTTTPPVVVTPVLPTPRPSVPPSVGSGVPQFPSSPVVTPSARLKRHSLRKSDDNPPVSAASLNAAWLNALNLVTAE